MQHRISSRLSTCCSSQTTAYFLCFGNYTSCLTAPVSHENHMDRQNHTTLEWSLTWNARWNTSFSSYICLLSSVATRSHSTTAGFVLIELISFMECMVLILNFKVNIFSDWYHKCLTSMTKSFLLFYFYSLVFLRKAVRQEIKRSGWALWSGCHHQCPSSWDSAPPSEILQQEQAHRLSLQRLNGEKSVLHFHGLEPGLLCYVPAWGHGENAGFGVRIFIVGILCIGAEDWAQLSWLSSI